MVKRRTVAVVTVGRSDYGLLRPVITRILRQPDLELALIVAGMHLESRFGNTIQEIEADRLPIAARVPMSLVADTPHAVARSMGLGVTGFADAFAETRPDMLLLIGDRTEMHAAAAAAVPFGFPLAHIHGGEVTEGAIDDALRHSITKLSHLHFVSTEDHGRRVRQMGEEAWRVTVSGAPGLDNLVDLPRTSRADLEARHGLRLDRPPLLVTFHPETRDDAAPAAQIDATLAALRTTDLPIVFSLPNADVGGDGITEKIRAFVAHSDRAWLVPNFGTADYFSMMREAAAMVGNSSSGLVEAPSFGLPVVNIGARQQGRTRGANVIDVPNERAAIERGMRRALDPAFRAALQGMTNPYGTGTAAQIIVDRLAAEPIEPRLLRKRFVDQP